ncbi:restriction endonuclease [Streptomyces sp. NPDC086033]|uniref:restriction endonuclease n=1 Tax=Streptomyces sp. NPDC086033 TaxID=3365747 RepID=UPI0037D81FC6
MARRRRGAAARGRRARRWWWGGAVALVVVVLFRASVWPYLLGVVSVAVAAAIVWRLWHTDRLLRGGDRLWRQEEAVRAGRRTLAEVDVMTGTEFEELVAGLCRRDGCTQVRRVGGAGDNGADVLGRLPDGRTMVVQCKRYAPSRAIPNRELRDLLGARVHFRADVAVFVTTSRFTGPSEKFALEHDILAVHRDLLGLWNNGVSLVSLGEVNGRGQGDARHRARWRKPY